MWVLSPIEQTVISEVLSRSTSVIPVSGEPIYEACLRKVEKMLYKKVEKAEEAKDMDFYAFSYYYDKAVNMGAIGRYLVCLQNMMVMKKAILCQFLCTYKFYLNVAIVLPLFFIHFFHQLDEKAGGTIKVSDYIKAAERGEIVPS